MDLVWPWYILKKTVKSWTRLVIELSMRMMGVARFAIDNATSQLETHVCMYTGACRCSKHRSTCALPLYLYDATANNGSCARLSHVVHKGWENGGNPRKLQFSSAESHTHMHQAIKALQSNAV